MNQPSPDIRNQQRKLLDEQICAEPHINPPSLPIEAQAALLESHLEQIRQPPVALPGVVENGLVRPLDPTVRLRERSRVIIVATQQP